MTEDQKRDLETLERECSDTSAAYDAVHALMCHYGRLYRQKLLRKADIPAALDQLAIVRHAFIALNEADARWLRAIAAYLPD